MKLSKDNIFFQVKLIFLKAKKQQDLKTVDAYEKKSKKYKENVPLWTM